VPGDRRRQVENTLGGRSQAASESHGGVAVLAHGGGHSRRCSGMATPTPMPMPGSEGTLVAVMPRSPSLTPAEAGTSATETPMLIFLYFHKAIRTELEALHGVAVLLATERTGDVVALAERCRFFFSIYKHHCDAEDAVQMLATSCGALFLCFWPFSPVASCWAGGLDPRSPLRLRSTSYYPSLPYLVPAAATLAGTAEEEQDPTSPPGWTGARVGRNRRGRRCLCERGGGTAGDGEMRKEEWSRVEARICGETRRVGWRVGKRVARRERGGDTELMARRSAGKCVARRERLARLMARRSSWRLARSSAGRDRRDEEGGSCRAHQGRGRAGGRGGERCGDRGRVGVSGGLERERIGRGRSSTAYWTIEIARWQNDRTERGRLLLHT
jgi:hypothetical protein